MKKENVRETELLSARLKFRQVKGGISIIGFIEIKYLKSKRKTINDVVNFQLFYDKYDVGVAVLKKKQDHPNRYYTQNKWLWDFLKKNLTSY